MYRTELRVSNTGKLPIEEATISVVLPVKGAQRVSIQVRGRGRADMIWTDGIRGEGGAPHQCTEIV